MKVFIFGANGMLGRYLNAYLGSYFDVIPITRNEVNLNSDFSLINEKYTFDSSDVIINAAGIIKQRKYSPEELIRVNSLFPHFLSTLGCNVIHITTDCVFSGKDGSYNEESPHDCLDDYGKSKSLGECEDLTVIRTSIIGEELLNKKSLIEWVKSNQNTTINGYLNHFWNGVTCLELSKHILNIIQNNSYWEGIRHYFSPDTVNKYQLVSYINEIYELNNNVNPVMSYYCDRSLSTKYESPVSLSIKEQILELKQFELNSSSKETKLKNFPSFNFVSVVESEKRRKKLYSNLEKYGITNVRPHIYERYKNGDHNVHIDPTIEFSFNDAYLGSFTSHLKAIREWYENTDEPYAFFCEDDLSFETVQYWNFTWEEFFNRLPNDWSCIQLSLSRESGTMFFYLEDNEVRLRNRWWDDWSCLAYLLSRKHAKNLLDTYYDGESFIFEYKGIDREYRMQCIGEYYKPTNETIVYTHFDNTNIYSFPLFVEDIGLETVVWEDETHKTIQEYSYNSIIEWWKTGGINMTITDLQHKNKNKILNPEDYWGPLAYIDKYNLKINGILHVGGHFGGEVGHYMAHNLKNIVFFEPLADCFSKLQENVNRFDANIITHKVALGNTNGQISINVSTNNKASSSILKPKLHLNLHPEVEFYEQEEVTIKKLDDYSYTNYNMLVVDVQGYELEVLKGSWKTLSYVDYVFTEVNQDEVYENNANILDLDSYLSRWNFTRVETTWEGGVWGDALYIKNYVG